MSQNTALPCPAIALRSSSPKRRRKTQRERGGGGGRTLVSVYLRLLQLLKIALLILLFFSTGRNGVVLNPNTESPIVNR